MDSVFLAESFTDLLVDPAHWYFELFVNGLELLLVNVIVGLLVWPLIKRHFHRDVADAESQIDGEIKLLHARISNLEKEIHGVEKPICRYGYTTDQVKRIMGSRYPKFIEWMRGSTVGVCTGMVFNQETHEDEPSPCAPNHHGIVTYVVDVENFLAGLEVNPD